jgi:ATP-dependent RNA helicase SUPV3L1/SUV3
VRSELYEQIDREEVRARILAEANRIDNVDPSVKEMEREKGVRRIVKGSPDRIFSRADIRYSLLIELIWTQEDSVWREILSKGEPATWGITEKRATQSAKGKLTLDLQEACKRKLSTDPLVHDAPNPMFDALRAAFVRDGVLGLRAKLKFYFQKYVLEDKPQDQVEKLKSIVDLCHPVEWFPETRQIQRKIHLHVGPTNSGKTYHALKKLEQAKSGIYAGPLRLLAHEVYTRLNARGRLCSLVTGDDRRIPEGMTSVMSSCTVEMVPLNTRVDVAVIDEIQMIGDMSRGWAWTNAFLGVQADEVHLCGELRTISLIQDLCKLTGDILEIHKYERLSPLREMDSSLKRDFKNLEKGDAIIAFSRMGIHGLKKEIEDATGRRCAVVYGTLPPETRAQQSSLFNDPDNDFDFLVASDAVGMGLNLSIKRVIFEATSKFDGSGFKTISTSEIKQIAGRAGRFRTAVQDNMKDQANDGMTKYSSTPSIGLVTTLEDHDMPVMKRAMSAEVEPLIAACIMPPTELIERFAAHFSPSTPLSYILLRIADLHSTNSRFFLAAMGEKLPVADNIQSADLTIAQRLQFIASPSFPRNKAMIKVTSSLAKRVAKQSDGGLLQIPEINLEAMDIPVSDNIEDLRSLETLHMALTLYLWLSYRFEAVFRSQAMAFHAKSLCESRIDEFLNHVKRMPSHWLNERRARKRVAEIEISKGRRPRRDRVTLGPSSRALPVDWAEVPMNEPLKTSPESETLYSVDRSVRL